MSADAIELFLQAPLAVAVAGLALYVRALQRDLTAAHEKRTQDAQQVVNKILGLVQEQNEVSARLEAALRANTEQLRDLRRGQ